MVKLLLTYFLFGISLLSQEFVPNFPLTRLETGKVFAMHKEVNALEDGSYLVLNFTMSTCKPCKKEVPELVSLSKSIPKMKLVLIFIGDIDKEVIKTLKDLNVPQETLVLLDRLETSYDKLNFRGVPHTFVIHKNKTILGRLEGYTEENMDKLKTLLKN
jgi:thiol-disulfide isomerase/thioredoxin